MSTAKTDGDMMNCCTSTGESSFMGQYRYQLVNGLYTSNYDPSGIDSNDCPVDRNGNSIYATFPAVGDQIANCRSSCLNGHPQDFSFTLYNPNNGGVMPIAERGVELYENYGLDTSIRDDSAKYDGKSDGSRCITDLGRKITLYGNVTFSIKFMSKFDPSGACLGFVGVDKQLTLGSVDVYYILDIDYSAWPNDRYPYFGNYGVTFSYGGTDYVYIHGQMADLPEVGYTINPTGITYYISSYQFMVSRFGASSGYLNPESLMMRDGSGTVLNTPNNSSDCSTWNYKTQVGAPLFPLYYTHAYFIDASNARNVCNSNGAWTSGASDGGNPGTAAWNCSKDGYQGSGKPPVNYNCYQSGAKSAYVPPHMEITFIGYYMFSYPSDADDGSKPTSSTYQTFTNTIRSEDSLYNNGTFPAFCSPYLPSGSTAIPTNRNGPIKVPPGTLCCITTHVRQDNNFYNKYVKSANSAFAPEIFLIPGIENATGFPSKLSPQNISSKMGNPLQLIRKGTDFWSAANPYWDESMGVVTINEKYLPGQVLFGMSDSPPGPSMPRNPNINHDDDGGNPQCGSDTTEFDGKVLRAKPKTVSTNISNSFKSLLNKAMGTELAVYNRFKYKGIIAAKKSLRVLGLAAEPVIPTGLYRITSFNVINGVYSIEWLYAIYYCAMNGRKSVQFDTTTGQYTTPNCTPGTNGQYGKNTCGKECLLFRDDYTYRTSNSVACAADVAMAAYGGMRNLSLVYGTWQPVSSIFTNDCSCITTQNYCPVQFNPLCTNDPSNNQAYVTAAMAECLGSSICNYCNVQINQTVLALFACNQDSGNNVTNFGDVCGDADCEMSVTVTDSDGNVVGTTTGDNDSDEGDQPPITEPPKNTNTILIIFVILIIIVIGILIIAVVYKKYSSKR